MFKDDASDPMNYFRDISTFGGCTAGPAAAIENMAIIEEENLLENTTAMGARLVEQPASARRQTRGDRPGARQGTVSAGRNWWQTATAASLRTRKLVQAVVGDCMAQGVMIGATNRSNASRQEQLRCASRPR